MYKKMIYIYLFVLKQQGVIFWKIPTENCIVIALLGGTTWIDYKAKYHNKYQQIIQFYLTTKE